MIDLLPDDAGKSRVIGRIMVFILIQSEVARLASGEEQDEDQRAKGLHDATGGTGSLTGGS